MYENEVTDFHFTGPPTGTATGVTGERKLPCVIETIRVVSSEISGEKFPEIFSNLS